MARIYHTWHGFYPATSDPNLILHLDAGNPSSYPGSGSTWIDLTTNNNNATLASPTFDVGGFFDFDAASTDRATLTDPSVGAPSEASLSIWARWDVFQTNNLGNGLFFASNTGLTSGFALYQNTIPPYNKLRAFVRSATSIQSGDNSSLLSTGSWYNIIISINSSSLTYYLNGAADGSFATTGAISWSAGANLGLVGSSRNIGFFDGQIAYVKVWNRALNASESLAEFNSEKTRFGL